MASFHYRARGRRGDAIEGLIEAPSSDAAASRLIDGGLTPVDIRPAKDKVGLATDLGDLFPPRIELTDLIQFSRQMHSLLKAGVPILGALSGLAGHTGNRTLAKTLSGVIESLEAGRDLSTSLGRFPDAFSLFYVSLVRVGETSGRLEEIFHQLAVYLEREKKTRDQIKAALRYPAFVIAAITVAVVVINVFVVPAFSSVFERLGADLPLPTRILVAVSDFMVNQWQLLLMAIVVLGVAWRLYVRSEAGRYRWHKLQLRLPAVGKVLYLATLARFARLFALAQRAGVPVITALSVVGRALDNDFVEQRVLSMRDGIERGEALSHTAASAGIFDHLVLQMLQVGEQSGTTDELLQEVSDYYDSEVDYRIDKMSAAVEPILIVALAALVFLLATGIFLPMWDLYKVALH